MRSTLFKQQLLFSLIVTVFFGLLLLRVDFLTAPKLYDEINFWNTSLLFSKSIIPSLDDLRSYGELNTPLPFLIYGALEHLSGHGFLLGRLLNLLLLFTMVIAIGWPRTRGSYRSILCLIGLLLFPYNFWYGGRLYTDLIACFLVLSGTIGYQQNRHILSGLAFVLAIASRQYTVAFPAAIFLYEAAIALRRFKQSNQFNLCEQKRWLVPLIATLSLLFWIYLFKGLTPQVEAAISKADPKVQTTLWAADFGRTINYLGSVTTYIVIPEFILFRSWHHPSPSKQQKRLIIAVASILLVIAAVSPPLLFTRNTVNQVVTGIFNNTPYEFIGAGIYYLLSLLTVIRFSQPSPLSLMVVTNSIIMSKVYPWDKYLWPLVIVFWYLKATHSGNDAISTETSTKSPIKLQ